MSPEAARVRPTHWGETEIRGPVHLFRERLVLRLFRRGLAAGHVLDAGCGSGSLALDLAAAGYQVDAVEASEEFVGLLEDKIAHGGLEDRLAVRRGSVTALPWPDNSFDGLVCGEVLEHITPDLGGDTTAVTEFQRVLRPGGWCVVSVPLDPCQWDHTDEWAGHVKRYTRLELVSIFDERGFEVEQVRGWGFPLGRVYHRLLFAPWLRRRSGEPAAEREASLDTRAGRQEGLVKLVAALLRFDELFGRWPWGRGIILCARLPSAP